MTRAEDGTNVVIWEDKKLRIKSNYDWHDLPEKEGYQIGYCEPIGPDDLSKASEYVPVIWDNGEKGYTHKSKIIYVNREES